MVETIQNAVRIKTVLDTPVEGGPFGIGNKQCLEYVLSVADKLGFKTTNLDGYCGYAEVGEGDEIVGIVGHLDVVPEGDGWTHLPIRARLWTARFGGAARLTTKALQSFRCLQSKLSWTMA